MGSSWWRSPPIRAGYGALCRLISRARRSGVKGSYRLERGHFENALDGCLIIWLPSAGRAPLPQHAEDGDWLRECFAGRLWLGVELLPAAPMHAAWSCSRRSVRSSSCRASPPAMCTCTGAAAARCRMC